MRYTITPAVRQQAASVLPPGELDAALQALAKTPLPLLPETTAEVERVHLAVLHLCRGTLAGLRAALAEAKTDWRDVLWGAGLAFENWPEVLRGRGITPSLSPNHGAAANAGWLERLFRLPRWFPASRRR